jgi:hypothetical protein
MVSADLPGVTGTTPSIEQKNISAGANVNPAVKFSTRATIGIGSRVPQNHEM